MRRYDEIQSHTQSKPPI